ncbi:MAG: hypothetical protein HY597_05620 [Candidatus Omnitrophica bacterium]|nr:hypothetical protein [Candidatus Omnitrophota bacterium]
MRRILLLALAVAAAVTLSSTAAAERKVALEWYKQFFPPGLFYETTLHHDGPGINQDYIELRRTWIGDFLTRREQLASTNQVLLLIDGEAYSLTPNAKQALHYDRRLFDEPVPERLMDTYSPLFTPEDVTRLGRKLSPAGSRTFEGRDYAVYTHRERGAQWEFWFSAGDRRLKRVMWESRAPGTEIVHIETFTRAEIHTTQPASLFVVPKGYAVTEMTPPDVPAAATAGEPAATP